MNRLIMRQILHRYILWIILCAGKLVPFFTYFKPLAYILFWFILLRNRTMAYFLRLILCVFLLFWKVVRRLLLWERLKICETLYLILPDWIVHDFSLRITKILRRWLLSNHRVWMGIKTTEIYSLTCAWLNVTPTEMFVS